LDPTGIDQALHGATGGRIPLRLNLLPDILGIILSAIATQMSARHSFHQPQRSPILRITPLSVAPEPRRVSA
jgi:hypothetical protein